jgi:hypothetical protein
VHDRAPRRAITFHVDSSCRACRCH